MIRLLLAAAICVCVLPPSSPAQEARRPNIVVIVADDLGYGDLSCQGAKDIETPRIDSLAKTGIRCTNGYVSGPYCSPTRAGLLTGRYQNRFGHEFNPGPPTAASAGIGLALSETTLADRLKKAGYSTGMVGKWHLGHAEKFHPLRRGFDSFFGFLGGAHSYFPMAGGNDPILDGTKPADEQGYLTDAFGREAVEFIERNKTQPFFLYLTFNAVHTPMQAPESVKERVAGIENERRRTYAGMLLSMDDAIGKVLDKLTEAKLEESTLIFFISDNGGPQVNGSTNGPLNGQKAQTLEGGIRVPFFVRWTGTLVPGTYDPPVIQLDIHATALAAAGIPVTPEMKLDGVDLLPHLTGKAKSSPHDTLFWRFGEQMAIRHGNMKLVKSRGDSVARLFDLQKDIGETTNLAEQHPDTVQQMQAMWSTWSATLAEPAWKAPAGNRKARKKRL
jgi:arylsulfatase A-like enzyme